MTYKRDGYFVDRTPSLVHTTVDTEPFYKKFSDGIENYTSYLKILAKDIVFQMLFLAEEQILYELGIKCPSICDQPVIHVMSPDLKIPNGYYGTAAHQDWPSVQGSLDMVTVWIALTDAGVGNFPLEVIPGSHLGGLREGKVNGSVLEIECDDKDFVPIKCKAGDVVFMSGFLIHRTGAGTGFRVAVSQRFDNAAEPTFIERGYPCAQRRVVDREIRWKPTPEQVRGVFK
jgi:hypothetical protein